MFENRILHLQRMCHIRSKLQKKTLTDKAFIFLVSRFYQYYLAFFYNSYIPIGATLGKNIKFNHSFHNIFISEHCIIGDNVTILQNTTIGSNQPYDNKAPYIGNSVYIGANCNIIGDVHIGNNSVVGAGTTIAKGRFPDGSKIVGPKYRVL